MKNTILIILLMSCKQNMQEFNKISKNSENVLEFKKKMEIQESDLKVKLSDIIFEEDEEELEINKKNTEEILDNFEKHLNNFQENEKALIEFQAMKEKILSLRKVNKFYEENNIELTNKNTEIAIKKIKEIIYFLSKENDFQKITTILMPLKEGFYHSGARTMLETEKALYDTKKFRNLKKKINFLINRSKEMYLELSSGEEIYEKSDNEDHSDNPHMISYIRNIMKNELKLSEDYYSEEDFNFYSRKFQDRPLDKQKILNDFNQIYSCNILINSIEEYLSVEELNRYLKEEIEFEEKELENFIKDRETKIKVLKAILIEMGHLELLDSIVIPERLGSLNSLNDLNNI